jgi:hypothetical protein
MLALLAGCAQRSGWERVDQRGCDEDSPAVVCVHAWPDQAAALEIGGETILPGECAVAPKGGGSLRIDWRDADGEQQHRRVRAPRRSRTELALAQDDALHVVTREACDPAMPLFEP